MIKRKNKKIPFSLIMFVMGMSLHLFNESLTALRMLTMYLGYAGYFCFFFSFLFAIKEGNLKLLRHKYRNWLFIICLYSLFMVVHGILLQHPLKYLLSDITPYFFFAGLLVSANKNTWNAIDRMIYFHFIAVLSLVFYIWSYHGLAVSISNTFAMVEGDTTPSLYWAWGLLHTWPYMFLTYKDGSLFRKLITSVGILVFIILAFLFAKRNPFLLLIMIFLLKMVTDIAIKKESIKKTTSLKLNWRKYIGIICIVVVSILIIRMIIARASQLTGFDYYEVLLSRLTESGDVGSTAMDNYRLKEGREAIFEQAETYQVLIGQGLGSVVDRSQEGQQNQTIIESGMANIFLKGGVIFTILWYLIVLYILKDLFSKKKDSTVICQLLIIVFALLSLVSVYFSMFAHVSTGYLMCWLGRCMARIEETGTEIETNEDINYCT